MLIRLRRSGHDIPLRGPRLAAFLRAPKQRSFNALVPEPVLRKLTLAPRRSPGVIAQATFDGALRELTWRMEEDELVLSYVIDYRGAADILGLSFDFPEERIESKRWLGEGPYRVWKNRDAGTRFGLHEASYSRAVPGEIYEYPEFQGFFGAWDWLEMRTRDGNVVMRNRSDVPWFGAVHAARAVRSPSSNYPPLGWSFLHAIPAIGTKFALPDVLGPQSQPAQFSGELRGEIAIAIVNGNR